VDPDPRVGLPVSIDSLRPRSRRAGGDDLMGDCNRRLRADRNGLDVGAGGMASSVTADEPYAGQLGPHAVAHSVHSRGTPDEEDGLLHRRRRSK